MVFILFLDYTDRVQVQNFSQKKKNTSKSFYSLIKNSHKIRKLILLMNLHLLNGFLCKAQKLYSTNRFTTKYKPTTK